MSNLTSSINDFINAIALEGEGRAGPHAVDQSLQACLAGEQTLRSLFATDPENPLVKNPYVGLFDIVDLPSQCLLARPRDWNPREPQFTWDYDGTSYLLPPKHLLPINPKLRKTPGTPSAVTVNGLPAYQTSWDIFSGGILSGIKDWRNIAVAGGSVSASVMSFPSNPFPSDPSEVPRYKNKLVDIYRSRAYRRSDIDLFLWGMNEVQAKAKMQQIFEAVRSSVSTEVVCFRTKNTITVQTDYPMRPVQIIMRLYKSPAEILCGFDVDCCCFLYNGINVFTNPRGLAAIVRQCNTVDLSRRSPSYKHRLAKYASRGYEVFYPALDRGRIDYDWLMDPDRETFPNGLARLIVYEIMAADYRLFPLLYADSHQGVRLAPIPMENLRPNNYDYAWVKIPFGPKWWKIKNIRTHVEDVGKKIIQAMSDDRRRRHGHGVTTHYHVITSGAMDRCLERCCSVPVLNTFDPTIARRNGGDLPDGLFRGPATFMSDDPGRQTVGSFNPTDYGCWESNAYLDPDL